VGEWNGCARCSMRCRACALCGDDCAFRLFGVEMQHPDLVLLAVGLLLPLPFHKIYVCLVHQHQAVQRAQSPIASKLETTLQCWLLILIVFGGNEVVVL
jgi:hypothetical protein